MPQNDELIAELSRAIKNQEFVLYYQPLFNLSTASCTGVEALIRWQHPKRGLLLPESFIAIAQDSHLILDIDKRVLKYACSQIKIWHEKLLPNIRVAVNVSEQQLKQNNFIDYVLHTLQETNLEPKYLELELNENMVVHDERLINVIHHLNKLGVQIALDDFGAGLMNAFDLKKIPVDRIKIDKTFMENIHDHGSKNADFVRSTIALAKEINAYVIAEGVETILQLETLSSYQCDEGQGSYFSEPLSAEEVEKFFQGYLNN